MGICSFSTYKVNLDGSLSHRQNLGFEELDPWMNKIYGHFATIKVVCEQTGQEIIYTDNGQEWEIVSKTSPHANKIEMTRIPSFTELMAAKSQGKFIEVKIKTRPIAAVVKIARRHRISLEVACEMWREKS